MIHLKLVDAPDPGIEFVRAGEHFDLYLETNDVMATAKSLEAKGVRPVQTVHDTAWGTRELIIEDDQGHTLYIGQRL